MTSMGLLLGIAANKSVSSLLIVWLMLIHLVRIYASFMCIFHMHTFTATFRSCLARLFFWVT